MVRVDCAGGLFKEIHSVRLVHPVAPNLRHRHNTGFGFKYFFPALSYYISGPVCLCQVNKVTIMTGFRHHQVMENNFRLIKQIPVDAESEGTAHAEVISADKVGRLQQALIDVRHFDEQPRPVNPEVGKHVGQ